MISHSKIRSYYKEYEGHNSFRRMDEVNYSYDGKFEGNILIVGRTGCGKTCSFKTWGKINYLEKLRRSIGSQKLNFLMKEKKISRIALKTKCRF